MFWKLRGLIITALTITLCVAPIVNSKNIGDGLIKLAPSGKK